MTSFYFHLSWFLFLFLSLSLTFILFTYCFYFTNSILFYFPLFDLPYIDLNVSFILDTYSFVFLMVVMLISSVIMVYSYSYMAPYSNTLIFIWLTILFVLSMLIVISMSNLFFIILGWDGLGLISFLLIVYYQNQSSITSGIFTVLINRIGDCFFLITISLFLSFDSLSLELPVSSILLSSFICLTFMTKSAIYPFSPWLPMAIAAPTPISALVHSSTLVTSGLFLMIRFSHLVYSFPNLITIMLVLSIFTSFYAGINSLVETDLNKLIALSTLSHLGFISIAFFSGLLSLSFFHLLVHALFKSLLFMAIGDIMINLSHYQDVRYLSDGALYTPFSCTIIITSILNLLGIPSLSGFYSNDMILESLNYSSVSFWVVLVVYCNLFFTYFYSYKLFYYSFSSNNVISINLFHSISNLHSLLLFFISLCSISFSYLYIGFLFNSLTFYPLFSLNFFPFFLNSLFFVFLLLITNLFSLNSHFLTYYFSNMMFLTTVLMSSSSKLYYRLSSLVFNSLECGFNYSLNSNAYSYWLFSSTLVFNQSFSFSIINLLLLSFLGVSLLFVLL